jgi:hypothetical protein
MDKERAKYFLFLDEDTNNIYVSKDLEKILDRTDNELFWVYAIIETQSGETLFEMDWSYSGEPIIMGRFIHTEFFFEHYHYMKIVNL